MRRPLIGITIDTHIDGDKYESPFDYAASVEAAGGLPLLLPYKTDLSLIPQIVDSLNGVLSPAATISTPPSTANPGTPKPNTSTRATSSNSPCSPKSKPEKCPPWASAWAPSS